MVLDLMEAWGGQKCLHPVLNKYDSMKFVIFSGNSLICWSVGHIQSKKSPYRDRKRITQLVKLEVQVQLEKPLLQMPCVQQHRSIHGELLTRDPQGTWQEECQWLALLYPLTWLHNGSLSGSDKLTQHLKIEYFFFKSLLDERLVQVWVKIKRICKMMMDFGIGKLLSCLSTPVTEVPSDLMPLMAGWYIFKNHYK